MSTLDDTKFLSFFRSRLKPSAVPGFDAAHTRMHVSWHDGSTSTEWVMCPWNNLRGVRDSALKLRALRRILVEVSA